MKMLTSILTNIKVLEVKGNLEIGITGITFDSRKVTTGVLFVARVGVLTDGHEFIQDTITKGAIAILHSRELSFYYPNITYIKVEDTDVALGLLAAAYFDHPSRKLKLVAITGTNGKTTVATLLYRLFKKLGYRVGLISTVVNLVNEKEITATHTTPDAITLNELFSLMLEAKCEYAFMEASSHAIHQHRMEGLQLAGAAFTNITHDHLDYHKTFDNYIKAKKKLFDDLPADAFALINADDKRGEIMVQNTKASVSWFGLRNPADYKGKILENSFQGLFIRINETDFQSALIGEFNAYNLLTIYGVAASLGIPHLDILTAMSTLGPAQGRFESIRNPLTKVIGIVDYAHTPDALKQVLATIRAIRTGNEKVITVVGCGGNRDKEKRPLMAHIASEMSDKVILTSDNPREEEPTDIISQMEAGIPSQHNRKVIVNPDRKQAIATACSLAGLGDIILLAGKGHEKYQEIKGVKHPFDDKAILSQFILQSGN